ncbi:MAG: flagellar biosynthesis protein FlgA [Mycobacterium sp.]|nr:MAG: flagellar biosynthesis protein FlgA [Mycobacterium sp.]
MLARRLAAGGLVVLAAVAAVRPDPDGARAQVVVAAHDLAPGTPLAADDVQVASRVAATVPDGAVADLDLVVGSTLAGPARRGEMLTDVRLLGSRLAESTAGPGARIVPVHPADPALADLVRPGDVVDVVAAPAQHDTGTNTGPRIVASNAVVVVVSAKQQAQAGERVVLVAVPAGAATAVAGATLGQAVTLALH